MKKYQEIRRKGAHLESLIWESFIVVRTCNIKLLAYYYLDVSFEFNNVSLNVPNSEPNFLRSKYKRFAIKFRLENDALRLFAKKSVFGAIILRKNGK